MVWFDSHTTVHYPSRVASWKESPVTPSSEFSVWLSSEVAVSPTSDDMGMIDIRGALWKSREGIPAAK